MTTKQILRALAMLSPVATASSAEARSLLVRQLTLPVAWLAPVGHFQPRARDIPAEIALSPSREEQQNEDRAIDDKLKICRGC